MKKKKVLFICHGNICRSPMAEMIFKHLLKERGLKDRYQVDSAATSMEEIGNPIYPPARAELERHGVTVEAHRARRVTHQDYGVNDLLVCMDKYNVRNLHHFIHGDFANKICKLLDFTDTPGDVADPWYSDRFDIAYADILRGCEALLDHLENE